MLTLCFVMFVTAVCILFLFKAELAYFHVLGQAKQFSLFAIRIYISILEFISK